MSAAAGVSVKVYGTGQSDFKLSSLWGHNLRRLAEQIDVSELFEEDTGLNVCEAV